MYLHFLIHLYYARYLEKYATEQPSNVLDSFFFHSIAMGEDEDAVSEHKVNG